MQVRRLTCSALIAALIVPLALGSSWAGLSAPPAGYSLVTPSLGAAANTLNRVLGRIGSVQDFPFSAKCDGSTDDTAAIQAAINAYSGNAIRVPNAACVISSPGLVINTPFTKLFADVGGGQTHHDNSGSCNAGPRFVASGANGSGFTMLQVTYQLVNPSHNLDGVGLSGLSFCANSIAGIGVQIAGTRKSNYENLYVQEATITGYDIHGGLTSYIGEASDNSGNFYKNLSGYQVANAAPIYTLYQANASGAGGNPSFDTFNGIGGSYKNAPALYCKNADSNTFIENHFFRVSGGTAPGVVESNGSVGECRNNVYINSGTSGGGWEFLGGQWITVGGSITSGDVVALSFSTTTATLAGFPTSVSYTVQNGDTTSTIATALRDAIAANTTLAADGFVPTVSTSTPTVVTITPTGAVFGEVQIAYTQGANTEAITFAPSDGLMVGKPTNLETVIATNDTNADPVPVQYPGAQISFLRANGEMHGFRVIGMAYGGTASDAALAWAQQWGAYNPTNGNGRIATVYDSSQLGWSWTNGLARIRFTWDNSNPANLIFNRTGSQTGGVVSPNVFTATADAAAATASDVSCFGAGQGSQNAGSNGNFISTNWHLRCSGNYTTPGGSTATLTPKIKLGSTTLVAGSSVTMPAAASTAPIVLDAYCTIRSIGTTGTITCNGFMEYLSGATGTPSRVDLSNTSAQTIDTTVTQKMDMTVAWSSVAGGQTATFNQARIEAH